jgi:predicted flap endonuclease-1-like 5' DNA nuclease
MTEEIVNINKIEGIGPSYAIKLAEQGIRTTEGLLKAAASRKGRQELAQRSGISKKLILEWVNRADLMRIKGVGEEYSDLLEAAGVDTVRELAQRNPYNLYLALAAVNDKKRLVRRLPIAAEVERWTAHAKTLDPMVSY